MDGYLLFTILLLFIILTLIVLWQIAVKDYKVLQYDIKVQQELHTLQTEHIVTIQQLNDTLTTKLNTLVFETKNFNGAVQKEKLARSKKWSKAKREPIDKVLADAHKSVAAAINDADKYLAS